MYRHAQSPVLLGLLFTAISLNGQVPNVKQLGPDGGIVNVVRGTANDSIVLVGTRGSGAYRWVKGASSWTQTSLTTASVNDFAFHPTDALTVYAATSDGFYTSTDAGATWTLTTLNTPVASIALYPPNPSIMYVGDATPTSQSKGVLKTTDGGKTWAQVVTGLPVRLTTTALAVDPSSSASGNVVYAGTDNAGVYQTTDGGNSWNILSGNNGLTGRALRIHSLALVEGTILVAGTSFGIYFHLGGFTWFGLSNGIADPVCQAITVVVPPGANPTVSYYVGTKGNEESFPPSAVKGGLYGSTSPLSGSVWDSLFNASLDVNSIFVPASNLNKVYLGTSDGLYLSSDAGKTWTRQSTGIKNSLVRTVAVTAGNPDYLFAGVYGGGVLKSSDAGVTWRPSNSGIENPYVRAIVADPTQSNVLYAGSVYGLYKSLDTGKTWNKLSLTNISHDTLSTYYSNLQDGTVKISPVDPRNLFISSLTGAFARSTDGGNNWVPVTPPPNTSLSNGVENIEFDPVSASTVYFAENGLWKSTDLGATWRDISGDLPKSVGGSFTLYGLHPRVDSSNVSVIYLPTIANSAQFGVYKTTNGGTNWSFLGVKGFDVSIDRTSPSTLFCAGEAGVYRSSDAGATWMAMTAGGAKYFSISPDPANPNVIYVGSTVGVVEVGFGAFAVLQVSSTSLDFDVLSIGSTSSKDVVFANVGTKGLTVSFSSQVGSPDFTSSPPSLIIDPGLSGRVAVKFTPTSAGPQQATLTFATNDPKKSAISIVTKGSGVAKIPVTRTVLLETTHGISSNLGGSSVAQYMSQFVQVLQGSGISVIAGQTAFDPLAAKYDAVVIAAPKYAYTDVEVGKLKAYVVNGGFLVLLADTGTSEGSSRIDAILKNFQWESDPPKIPTGLGVNTDCIYDSTKNYLGAPTSPVLSAFVDPAHPFVKGITSMIPFSGSSISVSAQAVAFLKGNLTTVAIGQRARTTQPVFAALSQVGSGRIFLIGDVDIWSNNKADSSSTSLTGILAGKNLQFALNVFGCVENYAVKLPKPTPSEKYQIISIPFDLTSFSITDVLKDLGSVDKTKWRLYGKWTGSKYLEFPNPDFVTFKRGEGYWLITKGERTLSLGTAKISSEQGFYPIKLDSGYNLIGNPFPYRVSWANSFQSTPDSVESWLWNFTGAGFQKESSVMEPFTGYFIKGLRKGVTIYINPTEMTGSGAFGKSAGGERAFGTGEWEIRLGASNGVATDEDNVAGVLRSANDEWDVDDFSEPPPAPTDYLTLSFGHGEWHNNPGRYAGDYRAVHADGNYWDFEIASAKPEANVSVQLGTGGNLPGDFDVILVDMTTERVNDVRSTLGYGFTLKKNEAVRSFRLIVGKREFVERNTNGIPLVPVDYALEQNFPNPFNPSTEIRYSLGHSGRVQLEIFDMLGRKVKTLFSGEQRIGAYAREWNGTNDAGTSVSSGVYFYRIRTEEFTAAKKMVLMK